MKRCNHCHESRYNVERTAALCRTVYTCVNEKSSSYKKTIFDPVYTASRCELWAREPGIDDDK